MKQTGLSSVLFLLVLSVSIAAQSYTWKNVNLQGMGYVTGIAIHPTSHEKYIRTDVGGAYRYDDVNARWIPITDFQIDSYDVEGLALNPSNANEVFIVVGNGETGILYKSQNKGATWARHGNFGAYVAGNAQWRNCDPRLAIDANNNGSLMFYASRKSGLQKSTDGGLTWSSLASSVIPFGIDTMGGQSFVKIDKLSGSGTISSTTVYVGVSGRGIYKSTNGGTIFALLSGGPTVDNFPVCADLSSTGILYVTYTTAWDGGSGLVYKYATSGTGTNITPSPATGTGFAGIDVCDSDPNRIVTFSWKWGWNNNGVQGIHYSTNGGTSWAARSFSNINDPSWYDTDNGIMYSWSGGCAFDLDSTNKVWFTHGYGVMIANNITLASPVYNFPMKGLEELVVLQVMTPKAPNTNDLFAAVADVRGFAVSDRDVVPSATIDNGTFGMTSCFDYCEADPNYVVRVGDNQQYWQSSGFGFVSTNGGTGWSAFTSKPTNAAHGNIAVSATTKTTWVWAPLNYSGCGWNVLPYYTTNGGTSWTACTGIPAEDNTCTEEWSGSKFLVADRVNGNKFYYYSDYWGAARFYKSTDAGRTFVQVTTASLPGNYKMKMLAVPGKEDNLYLCTRNGSALYFTTDGGTTWPTVSSVTTCYNFGFGKAIGSSTHVTLFVYGVIGGVTGIFYSTNSGTSWTKIADSNIPADLIDITGDLREEYTVYIATSGRGVIYGTASTPTGVRPSPSEVSSKDFRIIHAPASGSITIDATSLKSSADLNMVITDLAGKTVYQHTRLRAAGKIKLNQSAFGQGIYIVRLKSDEYTVIKRLIITE